MTVFGGSRGIAARFSATHHARGMMFWFVSSVNLMLIRFLYNKILKYFNGFVVESSSCNGSLSFLMAGGISL
jgi:hypothetical protein